MNVFRQELFGKLRFGLAIIEQTWILFDEVMLTQDRIPVTTEDGQYVPMILRTERADYFIRLDILQHVPNIDYLRFLVPDMIEFYNISSPLLMFGNLRDLYIIPFIYFIENTQVLLDYLDTYEDLPENDRDVVSESVLETAQELNEALVSQLTFLTQNIHLLHRMNSFLTDRADQIADTLAELENILNVAEVHFEDEDEDEDVNLQQSVQNVIVRNQENDTENVSRFNERMLQNVNQVQDELPRLQLRRSSLRDGAFLEPLFRDNAQVNRRNPELFNVEDIRHNLGN